jgi:integrase
MSLRHSYTTADYLPWDTMLSLIRSLYRDGDYRMGLFIGCGSFFGLRASDILRLQWSQISSRDEFCVIEKKTGKRREIRINQGFKGYISDCKKAIGIEDDEQFCFLNKYGSVITIQAINKKLKKIKVRYRIKIDHFSTHSLRKTFGRRVVEMAGEKSEMALIMLSELFNHSSTAITRRYLGLRQEEIENLYDSLSY